MRPQIQPLTLFDLADIEQAAALVEQGHSLIEMLRRKSSGVYAQLDFRRFVSESPELAGATHLSLLDQRWRRAVVGSVRRLGFDVDEERVNRVADEAEKRRAGG